MEHNKKTKFAVRILCLALALLLVISGASYVIYALLGIL